MVKVRELTRQELIDEISELRQKVIDLQSEIIRLRQPDHWPIMPNDTAGDRLPNEPLFICNDDRGY